MEVLAGFILGFVGSLHCAGMCGPIALSLPIAKENTASYPLWQAQACYNLGRTISYSVMGLVVGALGWSIHIAGWQGWVSIATGIMMLLLVCLSWQGKGKAVLFTLFTRFIAGMKKLWPHHSEQGGRKTLLAIGILNGFLPCGFVYVALVGAMNLGNISQATLFMMLFGIGTIPMMASIVQCGHLVQGKLRYQMRWLFPIATIVIAILFIVRGMALGIPYLSPELIAPGQGGCCH